MLQCLQGTTWCSSPTIAPKNQHRKPCRYAASARAERLPDWAVRPIYWFLLAFTPCPAVRATASGVALLVGCAVIRGYPFAGLCLRRLTPIRCTSVLAHWVWTTHPAPASGFAYGCKRVAANSGAPGLHPPPRTATARAIATTGATVSNTLAVQSVDLLVVSGRLPPPPAAPAGAGLPEGYALDACTPTTAVGSPSTHRAKAVSSAPSAWRVQL